MAKKTIYRSLFDSDDVYEVEEMTDTSEATELDDIKKADKAKKDADPLKEVWDAINEIRDAMRAPVKDKAACESKEEEVEVTDEDEVEEPKIEIGNKDNKPTKDEESEKTKKEVKDAYSGFSKVAELKKADTVAATQAAFQDRYAKVANK